MRVAGKTLRDGSATRRFAVLVFPDFPMMAFSAVIEPLRAANAMAERRLYDWTVVASGAAEVVASNGIAITPDYSVENAPAADYIVVCSGGDADRLTGDASRLTWIRAESAPRRPYRQRRRRCVLSGARRPARRLRLHPALAEPAGLRRGLSAHRAGAPASTSSTAPASPRPAASAPST